MKDINWKKAGITVALAVVAVAALNRVDVTRKALATDTK